MNKVKFNLKTDKLLGFKLIKPLNNDAQQQSIVKNPIFEAKIGSVKPITNGQSK